ncbi:hypothetical protein D9M68_933990 [compost metagenome]
MRRTSLSIAHCFLDHFLSSIFWSNSACSDRCDPAVRDRQQSADSVEKVGAVSIHSHGDEKVPESGVATRNLGGLSAAGDSDFSIRHALLWTEIAKGLFQQNRPIAVVQKLFQNQW